LHRRTKIPVGFSGSLRTLQEPSRLRGDRCSSRLADCLVTLSWATKRIGRRDPEDIELLALALRLKISIWSNDRDFERLNVDLFTIEGLLRHLRLIE
jgi:hypothetical protein